jgi:RNA polymerase sigma-70 factor, ECF subfamily
VPKTRRLSDASLVRRSQQGDRRAFGALVGRYDARLRGLAYALLLDPGAMDAALSSAYLRAWRDVVRLTAKDDAGAWLYRVTYNACIDALRRDGDPPPASPRKGTRAGLASLPPTDRVAVVLVDREGFTPEGAARILGLPPADFQARLEAARATLAPYLPPPPKPAPAQPESEATEAPAPEPEPEAPAAEPEPEAPAAEAPAAVPEPEAPAAEAPAEPEAPAAEAPAAEPEADPGLASVTADSRDDGRQTAGNGNGRVIEPRARRNRGNRRRKPPPAKAAPADPGPEEDEVEPVSEAGTP